VQKRKQMWVDEEAFGTIRLAGIRARTSMLMWCRSLQRVVPFHDCNSAGQPQSKFLSFLLGGLLKSSKTAKLGITIFE
jgi:hypothetical protein